MIKTTIPKKIRKALRIKPGDRLQYEVDGGTAEEECLIAASASFATCA